MNNLTYEQAWCVIFVITVGVSLVGGIAYCIVEHFSSRKRVYRGRRRR